MPRGWFGVYWYDRGPTTPEGMEQAIAEFQKTRRRRLARVPGEEGALPPHRRDALPGAQPELRRPRGAASASSTSPAPRRARRPSTTWTTTSWATRARSAPTPTRWTSAGGSTRSPGFRAWLREQYGSLDALNRSWGSAYRDWDAVLPLTTEAARREGRFAPWADHRTYMEVSFARAYRTVREGVREGDPEGRIALSGTQVTNPWNGCDWHRLDARDRRLPLLLRREPVGHPPLVREARRAHRLLDRLRAQRRRGEARGVDGGAPGRPPPAAVLEPLDRQPRHDVLALGPRPRARRSRPCASRGSAGC